MTKKPLSNCCHTHQASDTTVSLTQSQQIYKQYGILIPVGSGFCSQCRVALCNSLKDQVVPSDDTHETLQENTEYTLSPPSEGSVWTQSASQEDVNSKKRKALDSFLLTCGASPVKKTLTAEWRVCSERTKSDYIIKTSKILNEVLNVLVPGQETDVLQAIMERKKQNEERLLNIISAAYIGCEDWGSQRQVLSIVAHQVSYSELHALIPDLSRYKHGAARKHALSVGSGQKGQATVITHEGITTEQINHF